MALRAFRTLAAAALLIGGLTGTASADDYALDPGHTAAYFGINHLGFSTTYGRFNKVSGQFTYDAGNPSASKVEITIEAASVDTANQKRDDHLRGPDFFNVKQFPSITFKSKKVTAGAGNVLKVEGDFTMHGVTKTITLDMKKLGEGKDPWGNDRVGFETTFKINRMDFGVAYMPEGIGKEVTIMFSAEGIKKK